MKIAFLSLHSGLVYRGVETYVHELANRLAKRGHNVIVYQGGPNVYKGKYKVVSMNVKSEFLKRGGDVSVLINQFIGFNMDRKFTARVLKQIDPATEIVIATNNRLQAFMCRAWTYFHKAKLIIPGQGGPGIDERIALWSFPDTFVPLSDFQTAWAKKVNPFIKINKIPNGVDLVRFNKNLGSFKLDLPRPIVLCSAALWPAMKRQHLLIKAMAKVPKGSLLLVGEGESKEYLENLGKKLLGNRFAIMSLPYSQMPSVYTACDMFSFPTSSWEAFGIVLVEAMASGLSVVASNDPIRREIVGDAGLFVDPTNIDEYAKVLEKALDTKWGNKPRMQAEKFSWDKIAKQYEDLFIDLLQ